MKYSILFFTLATVLFSACKKHKNDAATAKPDHSGTYKGAMVQNGPGPVSNIPIGDQEFKVTNIGDDKIALEFMLLQMTVQANIDGNSFNIVPSEVTYLGNTLTISGDGSFENGRMKVNWKQAVSVSGIPLEMVTSGDLKKQ